MKKLLILLLAGFAAAFVACENEKTEGDGWFGQPSAVVDGTSVKVQCPTKFGNGALENAGAGFVCVPAAGDGNQIQVPAVIDGNLLTGELTELAARTAYRVYAFVEIGTSRMQSDAAEFTTGDGSDAPPPPDPEVVEPTFSTPASSDVTASSVTLGCSFGYTGDETISEAYFQYTPAGGSAQRAVVTTQTGDKSAALTGLRSSTVYTFRLCVVVGGKTYSGTESSFTTLAGQASGDMPYTGWAELPLETSKAGDYHYLHKFSDGKRNYTVCYSEQHRCAVWTAHPMHDWYMSGSAGRASFGYDPDFTRSLQPDLDGTYTPSTYHRGHMVASSDRQRTKTMNKQVFYYTNMAPQIQNEFNGGIWNKLEQKIQDTYTCADTLYVVTGSYFGDPSKTCKDTPGKMTVTVPTHFYKVLLRSKSGNTKKAVWDLPASDLKCCVFWFEHSTKYGTKGTPSREHMMTVEEAEQKTGFTFFPNVPNAPKGTMNPSEWGM